ncbi:helix-turn-helix domain-containing protein [Devosia sp. ZB163]|uniref:winged helix-turn-helix transcriptional regulator n=1 Tax=Devosia sp. ZB163 TaxID=3025938 RepID=UPI002362A91A|nr:helix-turn-helix domain-containing protein [Devosia sp. ZB163]MDC9822545.1 helix-turn-helix domain-containing protein [Devosia sp. ZB163]
MREQRRPPIGYEAIEGLLATRQSKWTLVVVLHLRRETMRFSELQRDIGAISQKALTLSLRALERDGFVTRTSYATIPPRVDYALTDLGHEALKAFEAFEAFASRHWHRVLEARTLFDARDAEPVEPQVRVSGLR